MSLRYPIKLNPALIFWQQVYTTSTEKQKVNTHIYSHKNNKEQTAPKWTNFSLPTKKLHSSFLPKRRNVQMKRVGHYCNYCWYCFFIGFLYPYLLENRSNYVFQTEKTEKEWYNHSRKILLNSFHILRLHVRQRHAIKTVI